MLSVSKESLQRQCDRCNAVRRVRNGTVTHSTFFKNIRGDLLLSGSLATDMTLIADMVTEYMHREDMPTILLSGHTALFALLRQRQQNGQLHRVMISDSLEKNYHPFYGMDSQRLLQMLCMAAQSQGYHTAIDRMLSYASAALNIVSMSYPVSLPALVQLLQYDDDWISAHALQLGLSNMVADIIRADHEAGIDLRRVCEMLQTVFEDVAEPTSDTRYSFQSGVLGNVLAMAFYSVSANQPVMNAYLKEELFCTLRRVHRLRVILDDMPFGNPAEDTLLACLFSMKRQGKIELILISRNVRESVGEQSLNFSNAVLSNHGQPAVTEAVSRALWGTYPYHYLVPGPGKPAALLLGLCPTVAWHIETEERLRVRAEDLFGKPGFFVSGPELLAVHTAAENMIYLVPAQRFIPARNQLMPR